jgi:trehalose 6-phosphate phosphatase
LNDEIERFFGRLSNADSRLLLLDFDGTLSPFKKERARAFPYRGVENRLEKLLSSKSTAVMIVSGRAIKDLKPLLRLKKYPELWGSHGWEHLDKSGVYRIMERKESHIEGLNEARNFIRNNGLTKYMEDKPVSIAIHFRGVREDKVLDIRKKIIHNWNGLAIRYQLVWEDFDGGLELRIPGFDKGLVVENIIKRLPAGTIAAYLGDDATDEDAFRVLPETALGVLVRAEFRETAAKTWIKPPGELLAFLDRWLKIDNIQ